MDILEYFRLNGEQDHFVWILDKSKSYSTRSMYRSLTFRGVGGLNKKDGQTVKLWKSKLPNKLKIFVWMVVQDRLQTGVNLKRRKWKCNKNCRRCGLPETMDHIFFSCHIAKVVWFCFKEAMGWDRVPTSSQDVLTIG